MTSSADIAGMLDTRLRQGQPPDIALLPNPDLLKRYAAKGVLTEAAPAVRAAVDENYEPIWKRLGTINGRLYGVFFRAADKSTIWYRPAAFSKAGAREPRTWDDFLAVARRIARSGTAPLSVAGGAGWTLTDWFENVYLRQAGPEKYDQLTRHQIAWTDPTVKAALKTISTLWQDKTLLVPGAVRTDFPASVTQVFGDRPLAAMVYEGDFVASVISSQTSAKVGCVFLRGGPFRGVSVMR